MMSSLTAKENRRRSPVTRRSAAKKAKNANPVRKKIAVSKSKKLGDSRTAKRTKPLAKSAQIKKPIARKAATKKSKYSRSASEGKRSATTRRRATRSDSKGPVAVQRAIMEPKPMPSPKAIAAIRAFESALKLFNRQDFAAAKVSFEQIIDNHGDQTDIAARVRTYLAICE